MQLFSASYKLNYMKLNISLYRHFKNLTQQELADLCNLSRANISDYERGKSQPSLESLVVIANALGVTVDELLNSTKTEFTTKDKSIAFIVQSLSSLNEKDIETIVTLVKQFTKT